MMRIIGQTLVKKDFKEICGRRIKTVGGYERLRREVEGKAYIDGKLDALQLLQLKIDLLNEKYDLEKLKEQSLTVNFPAVILVLSVVLGVIGSKWIANEILTEAPGVSAFIVIMLTFLVWIVLRGKKILDIRSANLLFFNTIEKILDRAIDRENEKISEY